MDLSTFFATLDAVTPARLRAEGGLKWSARPDLIGAWIAEADFGVAEPITDALLAHVRAGGFGYTPRRDVDEIARAFTGFADRRYGWSLDPEIVRPAPDVLAVLGAVLDALARPGTKVVLPTPAYMPFLTLPGLHGREVVQVPMLREPGQTRWRFDLDGLARAFDEGGEVLVLCNPVNPLGQVLTREEMLPIADLVEAHGGIVFSDEIHAPVTYPGVSHLPYASLDARTAGHTVTATSASKAFNVPGLKCAQAIVTNPDHLAVWRQRCEPVEHGASRPGLVAGVAAYDHGEEWLGAVLAYLDRNRRALTELTAEHLPRCDYVEPEGTYLTLLHLPELGDDPTQVLEREAGVMLTPGPALGEAGRGYVRLNFATPLPILTDVVERVGRVVARA